MTEISPEILAYLSKILMCPVCGTKVKNEHHTLRLGKRVYFYHKVCKETMIRRIENLWDVLTGSDAEFERWLQS